MWRPLGRDLPGRVRRLCFREMGEHSDVIGSGQYRNHLLWIIGQAFVELRHLFSEAQDQPPFLIAHVLHNLPGHFRIDEDHIGISKSILEALMKDSETFGLMDWLGEITQKRFSIAPSHVKPDQLWATLHNLEISPREYF